MDELLTFAEDVYDKVTQFLDSRPAKVPCVIRGRRDDANGVTMAVPDRIDLYLTAPIDHFLGARTESWLRVLLTHELTHFVHETYVRGIPHALSLVFGDDAAGLAIALLPGWAVEGPAVYDETQFSSGGRGRNPLFEIYTKAAAEEGSFGSLEQASYLSDFPPPGRIYVAGYALIDWLQRNYGEDTFRRILDTYLGSLTGDFFQAIKEVTGRSAAAVFADMRKALVARYAAQTVIPGGELVTPETIGSWTRPQPTARGLYLYHTSPEGYPAIVSRNAAGKETTLVRASLTDDNSFSATPDGKTVWFSSLHWDLRRSAEPRSISDLFALDAENGAVRQATHDAHLWQPAVSADGSVVVAVQGRGPYSRLVQVDTRTGSLRVLFSRTEANVYTPALSPDGTRVAFTFNLRGYQDVYVADLSVLMAGSTPLDDVESAVGDVNADLPAPVLGPDPAAEYFPSFQNDSTLLFTSDRTGSLAVYSVDMGTGTVTLRQEDPVAAIAGVADGDRLLYTSYSTTGFCIRSAPLATAATQAVETQAPQPYPPAITWTGTTIEGKPYVDWAPPLLWYPWLTLSQIGPAAQDQAIGVGAEALGGSLMGGTSWQVMANWLPGAAQPIASLSLTSSFGPVDLGITSALGYGYAGGYWSESLASRASLSWSLVGQSILGAAQSLSLSLGLSHSLELDATSGFAFADSFSAAASDWRSTLSVPLAVRWQWARGGGAIDFNPPAAADLILQGTTFLPLLSLPAFQEQALLYAAANIPSLIPHHVFKLGLKAVQYIGSPYPQYLDGFTAPRGFPARLRTLPGGMLASLDYMMPVALLDQPLTYWLALTGLGVGLHAEALADFNAITPTFSAVPDIFVGADITLNVALLGYSMPLGIGISAAVSTTAPGSFDPAKDIGLYLFLGFDSFASAVRSGAPAARAEWGR